jgi:erythromycin esterase-like protein
MNVRQNAQVIKNDTIVLLMTSRINILEYSGPHMVHTLENLMEFHGAMLRIIWEHNTHIGDARATDMCDDGTVNVKSLTKSTNRRRCFLWFPTRGRFAGREWGDYAGDAGS